MRTDIAFALLKKGAREKISSFRKGNFDLSGSLFKLALSLLLTSLFLVFFGKFAKIYLSVPLNGSKEGRIFELFSASFFALFLCFSIAGAKKLSREFFSREDLRLLSALPLRAGSVYLAGMISAYASLLPASFLIILPLTLLLGGTFVWAKSFVLCLLLPLLSLACGALLSLPYHALMRFLRKRYLLELLLCTALAALGFFLYSKVLVGVKTLLLGDDLKYFFNEARMTFLSKLSNKLYPGVFFAQFLLFQKLDSLLYIAGLCLGGILCSVLLVGAISHFMQAPESFERGVKRGKMRSTKPPVFSLLVKEQKEILRNPSYAFSCFSMAAVLPLMVYFCMSLGDSLVRRVVGVDCSAELSLFLTLIFGSLSNVFCSTNISREGENFYTLKALPVSASDVFGAKIVFCLAVSALSQAVSAATLFFTHYVSAPMSAFLFICGTLFSFAQICFATKYDFRRAKFSTEEDATASEAGGTQSAVILLGMLSSFLVGGVALLIKLLSALRFKSGANLLYIPCAALVILAGLSFLYLVRRLRKQYYEFSGGGLL